MNFYKTTAAFGATACLLMASGAFADATYDGTFDGETGAGTWTGGTIAEAEVTVPDPAGLPISGATAPTGNNVYLISESASNTYQDMSNAPFADMMVQVSIPDSLENLNTNEGGDAVGAKFAIAVGPVAVNEATKGQFKYWNGSDWADVSTTAYDDGAWVRVTMKFDYTGTGKCTVALDGNTCGTFNLINSANTLASIEVKGSTSIDEVKVASGTLPAFAGNEAIATGATATKKWLTANDVTWPASNDAAAIAKLNAQYIFGLAPDTSSTAATTLPLSFVQDDSTTTAKLSFPGFGAYGGTGTYVLQSKTGSGSWGAVSGAVISSVTGGQTATVSLPSDAGTAVYYRILAQAPANP